MTKEEKKIKYLRRTLTKKEKQKIVKRLKIKKENK
jgi:hypothetical protein